jgi:hypothetical protein
MVTKAAYGVVVMALGVAAPALGQDAPPPAHTDRVELRHQIYVMEGALSRAVEFGAQQLNRELRAVAPDMFLLAGEAQARGVYLDNYGVFFDVEVPMLRESMMWSLRMMLQQDDAATKAAVADLRRYVQGVTDPAARASLEQALRRLEAQALPVTNLPRQQMEPGLAANPGVTPSVVLPAGGATGVSAVGTAPVTAPQIAPVAPPPSGSTPQPAWLQDPNRAYSDFVVRALIDAMLDFSGPMRLGADEWLTVAARDNARRDTLAPQDPYEEVVTAVLRIKGGDLQEYRAGKIDKAEARKRVKVGEF